MRIRRDLLQPHDLVDLPLHVARVPCAAAHGWWIILRLFGSAKRFFAVPAGEEDGAMEPLADAVARPTWSSRSTRSCGLKEILYEILIKHTGKDKESIVRTPTATSS